MSEKVPEKRYIVVGIEPSTPPRPTTMTSTIFHHLEPAQRYAEQCASAWQAQVVEILQLVAPADTTSAIRRPPSTDGDSRPGGLAPG
ncbi:TPA: hypothetical protein ACHQHX_006054 [Pseudomonas aeruginosa]